MSHGNNSGHRPSRSNVYSQPKMTSEPVVNLEKMDKLRPGNALIIFAKSDIGDHKFFSGLGKPKTVRLFGNIEYIGIQIPISRLKQLVMAHCNYGDKSEECLPNPFPLEKSGIMGEPQVPDGTCVIAVSRHQRDRPLLAYALQFAGAPQSA